MTISLEQLQREADAGQLGLVLTLIGTEVYTVSHAGDEHDGEIQPATPALTALIAGRDVVGLIQFSAAQPIGPLQVRTTGATPVEVYRLPMPTKTGAALSATILAVDAGNGAVRRLEVAITGKRLLAGILQVGAMTQLVSHADAGATTWAVTPSVDTSGGRNDFVVSVTGAAGRTVDWHIRGSMVLFGPEGLA